MWSPSTDTVRFVQQKGHLYDSILLPLRAHFSFCQLPVPESGLSPTSSPPVFVPNSSLNTFPFSPLSFSPSSELKKEDMC
ncbi:hypothetical protein OWV82_017852 [Melia azedarach]|uniref:Uncharacterized protein n=1 Tax=Melia azedarach TaxID=155640 RepID=A0ACC1XBY3_MELAZ|nr:hypothetical protein OWV82_017852 [Melia azedarach]